MVCALRCLAFAAAAVASLAIVTARADDAPERVRGQIARADPGSFTLKTREGRSLRVALPDTAAVFVLSKASFAEIDFGTYVGAVSERMGDTYSPIYRDSLSWLHKGFELRIIDEKLRGIAAGHTKWDLTPASVMTHGWVDDMEDRVLSIKYGPTDEEETDVEISRNVPVLRMELGDRALVRPGAHVLVGVVKAPDGAPAAAFVFVGKDGIVPPL